MNIFLAYATLFFSFLLSNIKGGEERDNYRRIAFFRFGRLVLSHSTLKLGKIPNNVARSIRNALLGSRGYFSLQGPAFNRKMMNACPATFSIITQLEDPHQLRFSGNSNKRERKAKRTRTFLADARIAKRLGVFVARIRARDDMADKIRATLAKFRIDLKATVQYPANDFATA